MTCLKTLVAQYGATQPDGAGPAKNYCEHFAAMIVRTDSRNVISLCERRLIAPK